MESHDAYELEKAYNACEGEQQDWMYFHNNSPSFSLGSGNLEIGKANSPNNSTEFVNNSLTNLAAYTKATSNAEAGNYKKNMSNLQSARSLLEESSTVNDIAKAYAISLTSHKLNTTQVCANDVSETCNTSNNNNNYEYDNSNIMTNINTRNSHQPNPWSSTANETSLSQNAEEYNFLSEAQELEEQQSLNNFNNQFIESNASTETSFSSMFMSMSSSVHFPFWWNMFAPMYPAHTREIKYLWQNSTNDQYSDMDSQHIASVNNDENNKKIVVSRDRNTRSTDNAVCLYGKHNVASNYSNQETERVNDDIINNKLKNVSEDQYYEYETPETLNKVKSPATTRSEYFAEEEEEETDNEIVEETVSWDEFKRRIDSILDDIVLLTSNKANVKSSSNYPVHSESKDKAIKKSVPAQHEVEAFNYINTNENNKNNVAALKKVESILLPTRRCRWSINTYEPSMMHNNKQVYSNTKTNETNDKSSNKNQTLSTKLDTNTQAASTSEKLPLKSVNALSPLQMRISPLCSEQTSATYSLTKFPSSSGARSRLHSRQRRVSLVDEAKEYSLSTLLENKIKEQKSNTPTKKKELKRGTASYNISQYQEQQQQHIERMEKGKNKKYHNLFYQQMSSNKTNTLNSREHHEQEKYTEEEKEKSYHLSTLNLCDHTSLQNNAPTNETNTHNEYSIHFAEEELECEHKREEPYTLRKCEQDLSSEHQNCYEHKVHQNKTSALMFGNVISTERISSMQLESFSELLSGDYTLPTSAISAQREHSTHISYIDQQKKKSNSDQCSSNKPESEKSCRNGDYQLTNLTSMEKNASKCSDNRKSIKENARKVSVERTDADSTKKSNQQNENNMVRDKERQLRIEDYLLRRKTERLLEQQRRRRQQIAEQRDSKTQETPYREVFHHTQLQRRKGKSENNGNGQITLSDNKNFESKTLASTHSESVDNKLTNIQGKKFSLKTSIDDNVLESKGVNKVHKEKLPREQITYQRLISQNAQHQNVKQKGLEEKKKKDKECSQMNNIHEKDKFTTKSITSREAKVIQYTTNRVHSILVQLGARGLRRHGVDIRVIDACTVKVTYNGNDVCKSHSTKEYEQLNNENKKIHENFNASVKLNKTNTEESSLLLSPSLSLSSCNVHCIDKLEKPGVSNDKEKLYSYAFTHHIDEHIQVSRSDGSRLYSLTLLQMARKFVSGYDICLLILTSSSAHFVVQQAYNELTQGIIRRQSNNSVLFAQIMYLFDDYVVDLSCGSANTESKKYIKLHEHVPIVDTFVNDVAMVRIENVKHLSKLVHNAYNAVAAVRKKICNTSTNSRGKNSSHYLVTRLFLKQTKETPLTTEAQEQAYTCESEGMVCANEHFNTKYNLANLNENKTKGEKHQNENKSISDVLLSSCYICDVMFAPTIAKDTTEHVNRAKQYLVKLLHSPSYTCVLCAVNGKDDKEVIELIKLQQEASKITKPLAELRSVCHFLRTNAINEQSNFSEHYQEEEEDLLELCHTHHSNNEENKNNQIDNVGTNGNLNNNNGKGNVLNDDNHFRKQLSNRPQANIFAERILLDSSWFDYEHLCMFLEGKIDNKPESTRFIVPSLRQQKCENVLSSINNEIIYNNIESKHNNNNKDEELCNQQNLAANVNKPNRSTESTSITKMSPDKLRMKDMHFPLWVNNDQAENNKPNGINSKIEEEQMLLSEKKKETLHEHQQKQRKEQELWETNERTLEEQLCLREKNTRPKSTSALKPAMKHVSSNQKVFVPLTDTFSENDKVWRRESESEVKNMTKTFDNYQHHNNHKHNNLNHVLYRNNDNNYCHEEENQHMTSAIKRKCKEPNNTIMTFTDEHVTTNNNNNEWENIVSDLESPENANLHSNVSLSSSPSPLLELYLEEEQQLYSEECEQLKGLKKSHDNSNSSQSKYESNSSFFSLLNNIHTVVMLYSFGKESVNVTRDGTTIIATTQDDFEEHEVDEVLAIQGNDVAKSIQPELMCLPSSTITKAAKTFLHGCNVAILCSESDKLHSSYQFVSATVHTILTLLHELSGRICGSLSFSLARVAGNGFHDCLAPHDHVKELEVAVSPLFGSCIHDCALRPLTSVGDFAKCLWAALQEWNDDDNDNFCDTGNKYSKNHYNSFSKSNINKNCMMFCSIIAKLRINNGDDDSKDGSSICACSLTAVFARENIQLYEQLLGNKCEIPHTLLHHALGGPCFTVALLGLCANEQNAHDMLLVLDKLGSVNNRPLRSGNVLKFIKGVETDLEPAIRQKLNVSVNEIEKETLTKILNCLLEMRKDGEQLLNDFEHNEPKAYLLNTNTAGLNFFVPHDNQTLSSKKQHEKPMPEVHHNKKIKKEEESQTDTEAERTLKDKEVSVENVVHTLLCVQEKEERREQNDHQMRISQSPFHIKQNIVHYVDMGKIHKLICDDIVTINRNNDDESIGKLLQSEQLGKLTESFNNGIHINLLALDSVSCAMTPVILRRVVHNIVTMESEASHKKGCENKDNKAKCQSVTFYVSIVLITQNKVTDLLVECVDNISSNSNKKKKSDLMSCAKVPQSSFASSTSNDSNNSRSLNEYLSSHVAFGNEVYISINSDSDFDVLLTRAITNADDSLQSDNPGLFVTSMIAVTSDGKVINQKNNISDLNNKVQEDTSTTPANNTTTTIITTNGDSGKKMCQMHSTLFTCVAMFDAVEHLQRLLHKDKSEPSVLLQRLSVVPSHTLVFQCIRNDESDQPIKFLKALVEIKTKNNAHKNKMPEVEFSLVSGKDVDQHISRALHALRLRASQVDDVAQIEYINKRIEEIETILAQSIRKEKQELEEEEERQQQTSEHFQQTNHKIKHVNGVHSEAVTSSSQAFVPLGAAGLQHLVATSPKSLQLRSEQNYNTPNR